MYANALQIYFFISLELKMIETSFKNWYVQKNQPYNMESKDVQRKWSISFMREGVIRINTINENH